MDRSKALIPIRMFALFSGLLWMAGCGDVGGAGQCYNVEDSGVCLAINSIQPTSSDSSPSNDVDAFSSDCDNDGNPGDELIFLHGAEVIISSTAQPGVTVPPAPAFVTWVNYSVFFTPNLSNGGVDPPLTGFERPAGSLLLETGGSLTTEIELVPIQTKAEYELGGGSPYPPQSYTTTVTFEGVDQFNEPVVVQGTANINMADFLVCP